MTNKKLGNDFEQEFAELMFQHGFWVHRLTMNASGQPADIIAVKRGHALLIDCKVCSGKGFPLSRIEENQHLSMTVWAKHLNGHGWFAMKLNTGEIVMITYEMLMVLSETCSVVNNDLLRQYGKPFERWVKYVWK